METTVGENIQGKCTYDAVVIGAGIVGSMTARELSRFQGRFALLEKEPFSGFGVSKATLAMLHSPLMFPSGPVRCKLAYNAAPRYKKLATELDVVFKEVDEILLAFEPEHLAKLESARVWAEENHLSAGHQIIGPDKIREIEPHVSRKAIAALYARGVGGIYPTEWTFALVENAVQNGLDLYLNSPVTGIVNKPGAGYELVTPKGRINTRYIINAAGLFADDIAKMAGDDIRLILTKGTMAILDKSRSHLVRNMVYGTYGKDHSQLVTPTVHGNLMVGLGRFSEPAHKADTAVTREKLNEVIQIGKMLVPAISADDVITSFAGIRSDNSKVARGDFYIDHSEHSPGVIHAFIGSPGLTAAPAIAEYIRNLLADAGFVLQEKKNFQKNRTGWGRFAEASPVEKEELIASDPKYGHIVCRCEQVTEAEVLEAIRRGADTMDAVKHLTRAGMGRCQGGFCGLQVMHYLARSLGISPCQVTKKGRGSHQACNHKS
jgi:glycerol-3-phosphate dehydrogenase